MSPRGCLCYTRRDYDTTDTNGFLPKYRQAYIQGLSDSPVSVGPVSGPDTADFEYYEI